MTKFPWLARQTSPNDDLDSLLQTKVLVFSLIIVEKWPPPDFEGAPLPCLSWGFETSFSDTGPVKARTLLFPRVAGIPS